MRTLSDTELADFQVIPKELFELTSDERRAVRDRTRSSHWEKLRIQRLRQEHLRVAVYACYSAAEPSLEPLIQPFEALLSSTPSWIRYGFFVDQCDPSTPLLERPAFAKMLDNAAFDLLLCKSLDHFHSDLAEALRAIALLETHGIEVFFETENFYSGNPSDMRNLRLMANLTILQEKTKLRRGEIV